MTQVEPGSRSRDWSWTLVLVAGVVLYETARSVVQLTGDPALVPTVILLGAAVVPATVLTFVSRQRPSDVRWGFVALAALLGGVVGVLTAVLLESGTRRILGYAPWLAVGAIEELSKLLVPAALLLVPGFDRRPRVGLIMGVASGAGFAVLETMGYALVALVQSRGNLGAVNDVLVERGLASPAAHLAWTGVAAAALWGAAAGGWRRGAAARFLAAYVLVAVLHAGWDGARSPWAHAAVVLASLAVLALTQHLVAAAAPTVPVTGHPPDTACSRDAQRSAVTVTATGSGCAAGALR